MPIFDSYYSVILPDTNGMFQEEWNSCLTKLTGEIRGTHRRICKMNVFLFAETQSEFQQKQQHILRALFHTYGDTCPTIGISAHAPEQLFHVAIEAMITDNSDVKIHYGKLEGIRYVVTECSDYKELWVSGIDRLMQDNMEISSREAFEVLYKILEKEHLSFNHVVRQWNYIGKIFQNVDLCQNQVQYYHAFNSVRRQYYEQYRTIAGFPAATGIGMKFEGLMIDCCALDVKNNIRIVPIANPHQINPYAYNNDLYFKLIREKEGQKQLPLFERAVLITNDKQSLLFVSGTASIIGQDTIGKGDVEQQTRVTIENIDTLCGKENLSKNYPQLKAFPDRYRYIRVYVKNMEDIPLVKSICSKHFVNVSACYIVADICREDLLVEIEAEKYS